MAFIDNPILILILFIMSTLVNNNQGSNNPGNNNQGNQVSVDEVKAVELAHEKVARPNDSLFANIALLVNPTFNKDTGTKQAITDKAMHDRVIDMPQAIDLMKTVKLNLTSNGALLISLNDGKELYNHPVNVSERKQLNDIMNDPKLSDDMKLEKLKTMMTSIGMSIKLSNNFEQSLQQNQALSASIHR